MKILVVDDTKNIRTLITKCLQIDGHEVRQAKDGHEALELFDKEDFELVFLDIKMPNFSGTEVLRQIRARGIITPVVIITAYATVKNAVECVQMGAVAYLQKPFTAEKVRNVLAEIKDCYHSETINFSNYQSVARKMMEDKMFTEVTIFLKKVLMRRSLEADIYLMLAEASKGLGKMDDFQKYMHIYDSIKDDK